jgi:chromate reductase
MGQPEVYFNMKPGLITDDLEITDKTTQAFLNNWVDKFASFVARYGTTPALQLAAE